MARSTLLRVVAGLLFLTTLTSIAGAQGNEEDRDTRYLDDRLSVRIIGGLVDLNTNVAAGRGLGAVVDLEDVLGFDEEISAFGFNGFYRFSGNRRHAIRLSYANFDRDAFAEIEGSVPILDLEFTGEVTSSFIDRVLAVEYQYSFVNNGRTEAGFSAGLAAYEFELALLGGDRGQ